MKKILATLAGLLLAMPVMAFAGSTLSFVPTSPQTFASNPDPTFTCDAVYAVGWVNFKSNGNRGSGSFESSLTGSMCTGATFSSQNGSNMSTFNGAAGDIHYLYIDSNATPDPNSACLSQATATLTACKATSAWTSLGSIEVLYTLSSGTTSVPPAIGAITMSWGTW